MTTDLDAQIAGDLRRYVDHALDPSTGSARELAMAGGQGQRRRMPIGALVGLVVLVVVASLGLWSDRSGDGNARDPVVAGPTAQTGERSTTSRPPPLDDPVALAVLDRWAGFPVERSPRPLVMLSGVVVDPMGGFTSEAAKEAFASAAFDVAIPLPSGPASADGHPVVSSAEALERLRASGTPGPGTSTRLAVIDVDLGSATFRTDRGEQELPAWLVSFSGVTDPAAVLAVGPSSLFTPPAPTEAPGSVPSPDEIGLGPDERTLVVRFTGASSGSGPCRAEYSAEATESEHAVVITLHETTNGEDGSVICPAVGHARQVTLRLDQPLGPRVAITSSGSPVPATP